jgi:hypothetical protein
LLSLWRGNGTGVIRYYPSVALNFSLKVPSLPFPSRTRKPPRRPLSVRFHSIDSRALQARTLVLLEVLSEDIGSDAIL